MTYEAEPHLLPKVWPLSAHLEMLPAALGIILRHFGVAEVVVLVVGVEKVFNDGTTLKTVSWSLLN